MRKVLIIGLVVLNVLAAVALFANPAQTRITAFTRSDCCWGEGSKAYCCRQCCWLVKNCKYDRECRANR